MTAKDARPEDKDFLRWILRLSTLALYLEKLRRGEVGPITWGEFEKLMKKVYGKHGLAESGGK